MLELTATILSLIGNFLVARKNHFGFYIWILSNVVWIVFDMQHKMFSQMTMFIVYTALNIYGLYHWRKESK